MSDIQILIQFKKSIISFIDELIEAFPTEPDLIILRIFVINKFIYILTKDDKKLTNDIRDRNESVFLENDIFQTLAKTKALNFKKLWLSDNLDEEDKNTIWNWVDSFVVLSNRYAKLKINTL